MLKNEASCTEHTHFGVSNTIDTLTPSAGCELRQDQECIIRCMNDMIFPNCVCVSVFYVLKADY